MNRAVRLVEIAQAMTTEEDIQIDEQKKPERAGELHR